MCGISFLYHTELPKEQLAAKIDSSLAAMRHRGPDDNGTWVGDNAIAGHNRLAIIDLSASRQPMADHTGRFVLTYNGEIYNYQELRTNLIGKWHFQTQGDTEVLLAGLMLHGESFLEKMEGMWAFALWDSQEKKLLLCRDRIGKKPLYYQETKTGILCASELPGLAKLTDSPWQEDLDSTADFLRYGYYLPGTTAYREVKEVLPGHTISWSPHLQSHQQSYWRLSLHSFEGTKKRASDALRQKLTDAVSKRLIADVEVGAFLSGGVDSSLIVSILSHTLGIKPKTFTIGFAEQSYDERTYAKQMADYCSTDHYVKVLDNWDEETLSNLVLNNIGQPFADSSILPTSLVSKVAASHVKVALSGDGGDELFSGYQRYQARAILRWYTRLPKLLRTGIGNAIRTLPEPMAHHSRSFLKKAHLFQDIVDRLESETPYTAPVLYSKEMFRSLIPDLAELGHMPPLLPEECNNDDIQRMMLADSLIYLPQDILLKVDRASMAHSLETRAPFLDHQVVELAFSLPSSWHRYGASGKRMLNTSFKNLLPDSIWNRRKQGFAVPVHLWFEGNLGSKLKDLLHTVESPVNRGFVLKLLEQHRNRQRDHGTRLWSLYIYFLWLNSL